MWPKKQETQTFDLKTLQAFPISSIYIYIYIYITLAQTMPAFLNLINQSLE